MEDLAPVLIILTLASAGFGIVYLYYSTRHRERMALIEKGADASLFYSEKTNKPRPTRFWTLKIGIFLIGIGLGILMGNIIAFNTGLQEPVSYFSMIFLFGGLSLASYYFIEKNVLKD